MRIWEVENKNCIFRGSFDNFKNNIKIKYNNIIILKYKTHIKDDLQLQYMYF